MKWKLSILILPVLLIICSCADQPESDIEVSEGIQQENVPPAEDITPQKKPVPREDSIQPEPVVWKEGTWRGVLTVDSDRGALELPFNFNLTAESGGSPKIVITNGAENIEVKKVEITEDNITLTLPVFDSVIVAQLQGEVLSGKWIKNGNEQSALPFKAEPGVAERFVGADDEPVADVSGKWEVVMNPDTPRSSSIVGIFQQNGHHLTGTFLTPTGDYRFLEGRVAGNKFMLSCFDGAHSFLFTADITDENHLENGIFNTGSTRNTPWRALRNADFTLPDPETLTFLKEGYHRLEFTFPDLNGNNVSLSDPKYQQKVVIVQIFGTWCPNCMDETRFLAEMHNKYHQQGLEIIALAYEQKQRAEAIAAIERFKQDLNANYDFLLAGPADKTAAARTLPMLNHILSYPTAVFIDRQGEIRKIYTGFSGPGTGARYNQFVAETEKFIQQLLEN